ASCPKDGLAALISRLSNLDDGGVDLPTLVLQSYMLYRHGVAASIEVGQSLEFRDPASVHDVAVHWLALFIQQLDADFAPEVLQRRGGMSLVELLCGVCPGNEVGVLGDATLEGDRLVLGAAEAFQGDWITGFIVLDNGRGPLQCADLAHRR